MALQLARKKGYRFATRLLKEEYFRLDGTEHIIRRQASSDGPYVYTRLDLANISDDAQLAIKDDHGIEKTAPGGIKLNPDDLKLNVQRDSRQPVDNAVLSGPRQKIKIDGLVPIIINIQPMTNLPLFLGVSQKERMEEKASLGIGGPVLLNNES